MLFKNPDQKISIVSFLIHLMYCLIQTCSFLIQVHSTESLPYRHKYIKTFMRQNLLDTVFGKLLYHFWSRKVMGILLGRIRKCLTDKFYISTTLGNVETGLHLKIEMPIAICLFQLQSALHIPSMWYKQLLTTENSWSFSSKIRSRCWEKAFQPSLHFPVLYISKQMHD